MDYLREDKPDAAVRMALRAREHAPRSASIRETLGMAYYQAGRFRDALRELQAYRRITGRLDQNHLIADSHRGAGAPEKAIPVIEEALTGDEAERLTPEVRAEAAVVGAAALADMARYPEALAFLHRYAADAKGGARPHDLRIWYVTGDVYEKMGRHADAAREFLRLARHDPEAYDVKERLAALSSRPRPKARPKPRKEPG